MNLLLTILFIASIILSLYMCACIILKTKIYAERDLDKEIESLDKRIESVTNSINALNQKAKNPMKEAIQSSNNEIEQTRKITYHDNFFQYIQYQKFSNGKWVLHNLNGPAVINLDTNKTEFFIDGINYSDELQYLVAKETYNKKEEIL